MTEHLTRQAIGQETTAWCDVCGCFTRRDVFRVAIGSHAGKPGPCKEHGTNYFSKAQAARREKQKKEERNLRLF